MEKIAVIMGGLVYDSQRKILEGIFKGMDEIGADVYIFTCHVLAANGGKVMQGAHQIYRLPDLTQFDGIILAPNTIMAEETSNWLLEEILKSKVPAVVIDRQVDGIASVMGDNYHGMYELAEHLVTVHGKRSFYYLSGPEENKDAQRRKQAFLDVMKKHEIPVDPVQIFEGSFAPESGKRALIYWEREIGALPEVIICANDAMAQGVLIELGIRGIRIPEDVVITGVDNSNVAKESEPRMTSVSRSYHQMGEDACELLLRAERGEDISHIQLDTPVEVIYSESCGCREENQFDFHEFKRYYMVENFFIQGISEQIKYMMSDFSSAESFEELVDILKHYVTWIDAQYFYLCMNDLQKVFPKGDLEQLEQEQEDVGLTDGYGKYMTIPLAYENGEFSSYGPYRSKHILPKEVQHHEKTVHYIAIPLHYQNESFGYCVFGNSNFPIDRELCYTWVLTISGAIQNIRKNMQLREMVRQLNNMWVYDALTRVYNRAGFFQMSKPLIQESKNEKKGMYVLFMDLDGLKKVNDTYGHEAGDRYICAVAEILKKVTDDNELIMRYGGDEFAIMGKFREYNRAEEIMQEIDAELAVENRSGKYEFQLAISMGHEVFNPQKEVNLEEVLECADQEMYKHKKRKRER